MPEYEIRKWKVVAVKKRRSVKIPSRSIHSSVLISFAVFRASNRVFHPFHRDYIRSVGCMFIPRIAYRERQKREYDAFLAIDVHGDVLDSSREIKLRNERRSLEKIIFFFLFPSLFCLDHQREFNVQSFKGNAYIHDGYTCTRKKTSKNLLTERFRCAFSFS